MSSHASPTDRSLPPVTSLNLDHDVVTLTQAICDVGSVSGREGPLADAVQAALAGRDHLEVVRDGDAVLARTRLGRSERVVLAGHLDTVPLADPANLPTRRLDGVGAGGGEVLWGRGTVDMLGGVAVQLRLAGQLTSPSRDVTYVWYDCEEVDAARNGLARLAATRPDWLTGDFAVLLEPTRGEVEGGCNGTLRVDVTVAGVAGHSARPWTADNAVHKTGELLVRLASYQAREVEVDGLVYREALQAVGIRAGVAGNVIPDECVLTVNHRFAPSRRAPEAVAFVREFFSGYDVRVTDVAAGARPGLHRPAARDFVAALGLPVTAKVGWTDVARFDALGVPAVNFGPGDPALAHADDEHCPVQQYRDVEAALLRWLS